MLKIVGFDTKLPTALKIPELELDPVVAANIPPASLNIAPTANRPALLFEVAVGGYMAEAFVVAGFGGGGSMTD